MITPTKKPDQEVTASRPGKTEKVSFPRKECTDTTLGRSIFQDGIFGARTLPGIKNEIELKYAACLSTGGNNGFPLDISQIENLLFRQIAAAAVSSKEWTIQDLAGCQGQLAIPAEGLLIATLENPIWGEDDFHLFRLLQSLKAYQSKALRGGRTL